MAYRVEYSPEAREHLLLLRPYEQRIILDGVERQLQGHPTVETRNRRPMRPNPVAGWELRIREFRVYYDIQEEPIPLVRIRAIGVKERNQIRIGGRVVDL